MTDAPNWEEFYASAIDDNVIPLDPEARKAANAAAAAPKPPEFTGIWARDLGDLCEQPPARNWFLSDVRTEQGLLLSGKVFLLAADGGVGKGFFTMQLATCVALGIPFVDVFQPAQQGYVALLVGEDDAEECRHRLWRIMNALHLDREQRACVGNRLKFFCLTGVETALLELDRSGNANRTAMFESVVMALAKDATEGGFEWQFIGFDPLVRFAGGNAESDNTLATTFMMALEAISDKTPGRPAICVAHHESKTGRDSARVDARGVTGLRNGVRAVLGMKPVETEEGLRGVRVINDKNNCSRRADDVWLVRMENEKMGDGSWLQTAGALRLASDDEAEELAQGAGAKTGDPEARRKERDDQREQGKIDKAKKRREALLSCLPVEPAHATTAQVESEMEKIRLARSAKDGTAKELRSLCELNLAKDLSDGARSKARQWCRIT